MSRRLRFLLPLGLAAVLLFLAGPAAAQKVANPGTFNFKLTSGVMKVKNQEFGIDESQNINFNGTVDKNGNISIPTITFPTYPISASGFDLTVRINVVGPTTGTINPMTGAVSLRLRVWIKIDGVPLGGDCRIASSSSPIDLNTLITGTSGSKTGVPYNPATGIMRIVNSTFAVPSSSSCGVASGTVNDTVGLPSPAGNNSAEFNIRTVPNVNRAITPALTVNPSSGTAPFNTTLSAAGSAVSAGPATYRWDFTNNGSIDQTTSTPTTSHTYTTGGSPTARVQVVDIDGDVADATRTLTVEAFPDLAISAAHDGDFRFGDLGRYRISLNNAGYAATAGPVTVTSTLPEGLTFSSASGPGWSCSASGQDLTCTRSVAIGVGATAPELLVDLNVGPAAYGQVEPTFIVGATGDNGPGNDAASDPTAVRATDLAVEVGHTVHAMVLGPDPANQFTLAATNVGDAASSGPTVITDSLPAGLTPLSATGIGWACEIAGQDLTCTHAAPIAAGASTAPITVNVEAALEEGSLGATVTNQATVSTADDLVPDNDTASDPTLILDGQDIGITKSHEGDFTAGKQESYTLIARNFGTAPTTGDTIVTDELPVGLSFVGADGGTAWQCSEADATVTCVHADPIEPGAAAPAITLTVEVGVEAIPAIGNTAGAATPGDPNRANDSSEDEAVVQAIDLEIAKSHPEVLRVGHQGEYELSVQNSGDSPTIATATVVDQLPAGLSFVSADGGPAWSCSEAAGTVTCEHADELSEGEVAPDITLTVEVGMAAVPEVANSASVTTEDDFNLTNNDVTDTGPVIDIDAAVAISRTGTFRPGKTGTYLLSVENIGAVATTGETVVSAELPAGLEFVSATGAGWACGAADRTITCSRVAVLGAESTASEIALRVMVTTAAVPQVSTTATVATVGDRFTPNDSATDNAIVVTPDLAVTSDHEGPFRVGSNHRYDLNVRNEGSGPTVSGITLTDELPAGFTANAAYGDGWSCAIAGQTVTCEFSGVLAAAQSAPGVTIEVTPSAASLTAGWTVATVSNEAGVTTDVDGDPSDNEFSDQTDLVAVDLSLAMDAPAEIAVGGTVEYELTVINDGAAATESPAEVKDTVPFGFTPRSSGGEDWICSSVGRKINCSYGQPLPAGEAAPGLTIRALAGVSASSPSANPAKVSTGGDVIAANDTVTAESMVVAAPDLEVGLQARPQIGNKFRVGTDGGYDVTVRNRGSAPTSGVTSAEIELPAGVSFLGLDSGQGWVCPAASAAIVICEHSGPIDPGEISAFGFAAEIGPATPNEVSARAEVTGDSDLNPENDAAVALTEVTRIDLELTRAHEPVWTVGGVGRYDLRVANTGTAPTTGPIEVTEDLPLGTTYASAAGEGWTCSVSGRRLRCVTQNSLAAGEASGLKLTLDLGPATGERLDATSTVKTADDANASNDTATEEIAVAAGASVGGARAVRILTKRTTATESGIVPVWVACPADSAVKCRGSLTLKSAGKIRLASGKRVTLTLGRAPYRAAPGMKAPVRMAMKKNARRALVRAGTMRVKATATNGGGLADSRGSIRVRAGK